jgi:hypothetical protein
MVGGMPLCAQIDNQLMKPLQGQHHPTNPSIINTNNMVPTLALIKLLEIFFPTLGTYLIKLKHIPSHFAIIQPKCNMANMSRLMTKFVVVNVTYGYINNMDNLFIH